MIKFGFIAAWTVAACAMPVNPDPARALTSEPINTINGNITFGETDLQVPCPGFDLEFSRSYNSAAIASNTLGSGWSHNLAWALATVSNTAYGSQAGTFKVLSTGDGRQTWFLAQADGSYALAPPQTEAEVTAVTHPDGSQESFAFDALGNLTNVVDAAGRTNVLAWYPTGKPASVSRWLDGPNPTNVTVSFAYDRQFNTLRITDPMSRSVESYKLDAQDRPVSVTNIQGQVMTINWGVGDHVRSLIRFDGTTVTNPYGTDGWLAEVRMPGTAAMAGVTNKYSYYQDDSLRTAMAISVAYGDVTVIR